MDDTKPTETKCATVAVLTVPPFFETDPLLWFIHLEAEFFINNVLADRARYSQLISRLPKEISLQLRDLLINPPATDLYETLKDAVIKRVTPSEKTRLQQLFSDLQLGDKRPTTLLREMKQLLGTSQMDESLLRELWIQRLPETAQAIISIASSLPLAEAANIADKVVERFQQRVNHVEVPHTNPQGQQSTSLVDACAASTSNPANVDSLWAEVAALRRDFSRFALNRSPRRRTSRSPRRPFVSSENGYCFYHARFGNRASRCQQPCSYKAANQGNFQADA